jgi:hypothetical protein
MFTKVYSYQLAPNTWDNFWVLQKKADSIYRRHVDYSITFVRDAENDLKITEIHVYPDLDQAKRADNLHKVEPELNRLFEEFIKMLDPMNKVVKESFGETLSLFA